MFNKECNRIKQNRAIYTVVCYSLGAGTINDNRIQELTINTTIIGRKLYQLANFKD